VASAPHLGIAGGYDAAQLATYCWASQGLIGMVMLWGWTELSDRIRSGDVVTDLLRPVHPITSYLAVDLGRAAHASLTRLLVPMLVGAVFFDLYLPRRPATYPLVLVSVLLAIVVSFACRYLVNATAYWLLDTRGINLIWTFATAVLAGLSFPLHFLPAWLVATLWVTTPFPSILQAPLDVLVEYGSNGYSLAVTAGQAAWVVVLLAICWYVQRRADRKLVIQGG
jgi:ABC-2 type transport system permease protein